MDGAVSQLCSGDHMRVVIYIQNPGRNIEYEMAGWESGDSISGAFKKNKNYNLFMQSFQIPIQTNSTTFFS